jgi:hypothetical protein
VDEVTLHDVALTELEVQSLYNYQVAWYDTKASKLITVDADNPQVHFEHDGQYLPDAPATLWMRATDATSQISQLEVSYSGPNGTSGVLTPQLDRNSDSMWSVPFVPIGAGTYQFEVKATDSVSHTATASGVVYVDTTPPTIALAANQNGASFGNTNVVALNGTLVDPGQPASGVAANTVTVDVRDANGVSLDAIHHAVVTGGTWQVEYPLPDAAYGSYHVWASVTDQVGNVYSATIGSISLDDLAPLANLVGAPDVITQTGIVVSGMVSDSGDLLQSAAPVADVQTTSTNNRVASVQIRFRHASGSVWPQLDPSLTEQVVFHAPFDTQPYADTSSQGRFIATEDSSGILQIDGRYGGAIFLRGASALTAADDPAWGFDSDSFAVATWVYFEGSGPNLGYIVNKNSHGNNSPGWSLRLNSNETITFDVTANGSTFATATSGFLDTNAWHHLIAVMDVAAAQIRLYVDGALAASAPWVGNIASSAPLVIGSNGTSFAPGYFVGALDDLVIFDQALTNAEARLLAQAETWRPVTLAEQSVAATNWHYVITDQLEGPYKIDLLTKDEWGNRNYIPNVWSGEIDTLAPRVALGYLISADKRSAQVTCAASDYNLTLDGWVCPVDDGSLVQHNKDALWFTTIFSDTQKLAGLSTGVESFTPTAGLRMTACDSFGNCSSQAPTDTDGDGIPDHVEGDSDRDGDGIPDAHDYDPDGHFYELNTGKIIPGGQIEVTGSAPVLVGKDGSDGFYEWMTNGTPGPYTMIVTPPPGYIVSPDCPAQPGAIGPAGDQPIILGSSEVTTTMSLADATCAANPYYLNFNIEADDPFIFNNNIPLAENDPTALPPSEQPSHQERILLPLISGNPAPAVADPTFPDENVITEKKIRLPLIIFAR